MDVRDRLEGSTLRPSHFVLRGARGGGGGALSSRRRLYHTTLQSPLDQEGAEGEMALHHEDEDEEVYTDQDTRELREGLR